MIVRQDVVDVRFDAGLSIRDGVAILIVAEPEELALGYAYREAHKEDLAYIYRLLLIRVQRDFSGRYGGDWTTLDGAMHQYGVEATLGADFVVGFLTRRANAIADGIGSGAAQALGAL